MALRCVTVCLEEGNGISLAVPLVGRDNFGATREDRRRRWMVVVDSKNECLFIIIFIFILAQRLG